MNGAVGYQVLDDGTFVSLGLIFGSAAALFVGTGYIALDTGFSWTGFFDSTLAFSNRSYSLYTLYQLVPLVFLVIYFILEANLTFRVLGEKKPIRMFYSSCPHHIMLTSPSLPSCCCVTFRYRPSVPIRHQRSHLQWRAGKD